MEDGPSDRNPMESIQSPPDTGAFAAAAAADNADDALDALDTAMQSHYSWYSSREAVNIVFLPRRLPQFAQADQDESDAIKALADVSGHVLPKTTLAMLHRWHEFYILRIDELSASCRKLSVGDTLPVHLNAQNAALTFTKLDGGQVAVRAFSVQQPVKKVTSARGSLLTIEPHTSIRAPAELVFSGAFLRQLVALQSTTFSDAKAKVKASNHIIQEPRDVPSPKYVLQWLLSVLSAVGSEDNQTLAIQKKIRDSVCFTAHGHMTMQPWRRHSTWFAFKNVLHATLINDVQSAKLGTLLYKAALLQFMLPFVRSDAHVSCHDLMQQMLAKVSQRIQKLSSLLTQYAGDIQRTHAEEIERVLQISADVVQRVCQNQRLAWEKSAQSFDTMTLHSRVATLPPVLEGDIRLPLEVSQQKLEDIQSQKKEGPSVGEAKKRRHANRDSLMELANGDGPYTAAERFSGIHDFEVMILDMWSHGVSADVTSRQLRDMMCQYAQATTKIKLCNDPIGRSRRLLVGAVMVVLCDMKTMEVCPLLKEHVPGIETEPLKQILAHDSRLLVILFELERYVKNRQQSAKYQTGPLETSVSRNSISVAYVKQSDVMLQNLEKLKADDQVRKESHACTIQAAFKKMARDKQDLRQMDCDTGFVVKKTKSWKEQHNRGRCSKCLKKKELSVRKASVFESQLPESLDEQYAVVFEANLPESIGVWRDAVYVYCSEILQAFPDDKVAGSLLWRDDVTGSAFSSTVALGSMARRIADTHYGTAKLCDGKPSDFFTECRLTCALMAKPDRRVVMKPHDTCKKHEDSCCFKLSNPALQMYLPNCCVQQSEVLARQADCPQNFSKSEFIAFGSLRSGDRLQWFNILRGIHQRTILLHQPEVVQLLCQAVWQAGETSLEADYLRHSHQPCGQKDFVTDMAGELKKVLASAEDNWQNHWTLCAVVVLTNRLLDIGSQSSGYDAAENVDLRRILQKCRDIAQYWLMEIHKLVQEETDADITAELRHAASCVATFGALSYCHQAKLISLGKAILQWMRFITEMRNNMQVMLKSQAEDAVRCFFLMVKCVVRRITIDRHGELVELLRSDCQEVTAFLEEFYRPGRCVECRVHEDDLLWVSVKWKQTTGVTENVEVDLRCGQFYVDGYPVAHLPDQVVNSDIYTRHFGDLVFSVKPCTGPRNERAQITEKQNGISQLVFSDISHQDGTSSISIYELTEEDGKSTTTLLLLPADWFVAKELFDVPHTLLENSSCWLDVTTGVVYFRAKQTNSEEFRHYQYSDFILECGTGLLKSQESVPTGIKPGSVLLSQSSSLGRAALKVLSGLELPEYTELWKQKDGLLLIRLPRLSLSFEFRPGEDVLQSVDHKGWSVDKDQSIGTLLGLASGLVLVRDKGHPHLEQRCIIVPHGDIQTSAATSTAHHCTRVELKSGLRTPPVFRFDMDKELKRLTGALDLTAWIYLASLHAYTSSVFPDEFTGLTGMEAAMNILQSARCWSSIPLEATSKLALKDIEKLSPVRTFFPYKSKQFMEVTEWPRNLRNSLCASDAYGIIVQQISMQHKRLSFLHHLSEAQVKGKIDQTGQSSHANQDDGENSSDDAGDDDLDATLGDFLADFSSLSLTKNPPKQSGNHLAGKSYCRYAYFYPVMARLERHNQPKSPCEFSMQVAASSSSVVVETTRAVMLGKARTALLPQQKIECALLLRSNVKEYQEEEEADSYADEDDSSDGASFNTRISEEQLLSCGSWPKLQLPQSFFKLHHHINDCKPSGQRLHLTLLLSFLLFRLQNGEPDSLDLSNVHLVNALVSLSSSTTPEFAPPGCPVFPKTKFILSSSNDFLDSFFEEEERYLTRHGVTEPRMYREYDVSEIEREAWKRKRRQALDQYSAERSKIRQAIDADLRAGNAILSAGPYCYESTGPVPPGISPSQMLCKSFTVEVYRREFNRQMNQANRSSILSSYVGKILRHTDGVAVSSGAPSHNLRSMLGERVEPASATVLYYQCVPSRVAEALQPLWSAVNPLTHPQDSNTLFEANDRLLDAPVTLLLNGLERESRKDPIAEEFAENLSQSIRDLEEQPHSRIYPELPEVANGDYDKLYRTTRSVTTDGWRHVCSCMEMVCNSKHGTRALRACGLLCRTHPLAVLPILLRRKVLEEAGVDGIVDEQYSTGMEEVIGGLAVSQVRTQQRLRILRYANEEQSDRLIKETETIPHGTWVPEQHPEWLIFELENDLCIRQQQVEVSQQMMTPPDSKHAVMQLNMGEGKTSVILPIVAAELADGRSLVRLIVLTSLFNTNSTQLVFKLGGLLNRRILSLPFRRDVRLKAEQLEKILCAVEKCRRRFGAVVSVREHALSLQLKYYEACGTSDDAIAVSLGRVHEFFDHFARDIIDEADEVLHHRFQLVYPMGEYGSPDGEDTRWLMAEVVLECVRYCAVELFDYYKATVNFAPKKVQKFPHLRILNTALEAEAYRWLCEKIATRFLAGRGQHGTSLSSDVMDEISAMSTQDRAWLKKEFILSKEIDESCIAKFQKTVPQIAQPALLCLRGLLANDILLLALQKRYRVEYGLLATTNQKCSSGQRVIHMAVPFRTKDVAAERTEFGHIDVAILLTLLSYYQHGLTDAEIEQAFDKLDGKDNCSRNAIYESWVSAAQDVHASVQHFDGINRKDKGMMKKLVYSFLRKHTTAINFYLNHYVFLHEAKEFPMKLVGNAWSLVAEQRDVHDPRIVTGFSGTNDTRHLLPASISQRDLDTLKHTNAYVCSLVLEIRNDVYTMLPAQCSGQKILQQLTDEDSGSFPKNVLASSLNTLIDVGAMILDLSNEEVAEMWLSHRQDKRAVVYFDRRNQLQVFDRQTQKTCKLELSPYASDLSECLVYLDHSHTRGTDLRMAAGTIAAVTLGKGLRRDELVQACMRMRRLGFEHTLSFWAPPEVDKLIREKCKVEGPIIHHSDVLQWCFFNSIDTSRNGFQSWATQGLAFLHTANALTATRDAHGGLSSVQAAHVVGGKCLLPDSMTLEEMYRRPRARQDIADIIRTRAKDVPGGDQLVETCQRFVPNVSCFAQTLDEEQERELEQEIEEEKQEERRPRSEHIEESCPEYLIRLVRTGSTLILREKRCDAVAPWQCLTNTSLVDEHRSTILSKAWNCQRLLATKSYSATIKPQSIRRSNPAPLPLDDEDEVERFQRQRLAARASAQNQLRTVGSALARVQRRTNYIDEFLRPAEWVLVIRAPDEHARMLLLSPYEANHLLSVPRWHRTVSMHVYASPLHQRQGIIADWDSTVAGHKLPDLRTETAVNISCLFAELLCFSGGLFFGRSPEERLSTMRQLARLLQVAPGIDADSDQPVAWQPTAAGSGFNRDPLLLVRSLLRMLHSSDTLEVSHMGSLLKRSWPNVGDP